MDHPQTGTRLLEESSSGFAPDPSHQQKPFVSDDAAASIRGPDSHPQPTKELDKRSLGYIVRSGVAGGLAGCAAKTVVGPLDRVKINFQASNPQFQKYTGSSFGVFIAMRDINKSTGLRGLFRGHSATLLRVFPYAGIKFLAYEQFRHIFIPDKSKETHWRRFVSGSLAGITSVFFTYPLEVIRVRLAFETKKDGKPSLRRICKKIYNERPAPPKGMEGENVVAVASEAVQKVAPRYGLVNFYRGFSPTLLGMIPYAGVSFLTHDAIGDWFRHPSVAKWTVMKSSAAESEAAARPGSGRRQRKVQLTAPAELTSGAIAGVVSQTASYPLEVTRRRMQVGGVVGDGHRLTISETVRRIWMERGLRGFFIGLTIGYLKVIPMTATSFYVYERSKWVFGID